MYGSLPPGYGDYGASKFWATVGGLVNPVAGATMALKHKDEIKTARVKKEIEREEKALREDKKAAAKVKSAAQRADYASRIKKHEANLKTLRRKLAEARGSADDVSKKARAASRKADAELKKAGGKGKARATVAKRGMKASGTRKPGAVDFRKRSGQRPTRYPDADVRASDEDVSTFQPSSGGPAFQPTDDGSEFQPSSLSVSPGVREAQSSPAAIPDETPAAETESVTPADETPFYKKPVVIGAVLALLAGGAFLVTRKRKGKKPAAAGAA